VHSIKRSDGDEGYAETKNNPDYTGNHNLFVVISSLFVKVRILLRKSNEPQVLKKQKLGRRGRQKKFTATSTRTTVSALFITKLRFTITALKRHLATFRFLPPA